VALTKGSGGYRRLTLAMLFAGFSTFSLLYATQPLLPLFARDFGLTAEAASLAVGLATGPLAIGILVAGALSDRWGRRPMMVAAMFLAGGFTLATALAPGWAALLALRFATGVALAGVPAVAMAYVSEEVDSASVGSAMGLYIAGSAVGGMAGRLGVSLLTDWAGWRGAVAAVGVAGLAMAEAFRRLAPESRHFTPSARSVAATLRGFVEVFRDRAMPLLFAEAFVLMGVFVSIYNYAGFRLMAPPYALGHAAVGAIFLALSARLGELDLVRRDRGQAGAAADILDAGGAVDRRRRADRGAAAGAGRGGDRRRHDRLFRRAFDRERLGRQAGGWPARTSGGAISVFLLRRIERAGVARRGGVDPRSVARRGVVLWRAWRRGAGTGAGVADDRAIAGE